MTDVTPCTFDELMSELYSIDVDQHGRYRSDFVYRGVDVSGWGLETSLQRLGNHHQSVEGPLLRNFLKYSVDRELSTQSLMYRLAFAQHHGLPTRVLDWSTAPKVALHFACGDETKYDNDGIIWAVNIMTLRASLPDVLKAELNKNRAYIFSLDMLTQLERLDQLDRLGLDAEFALFFEPPSLDVRIVNQAAILSVMPGASLSLETYLRGISGSFRRIIIPKALKWEIRDKLDQDQINERMLFPGEDGTARWLKRYYGQGPKQSASIENDSAYTGPMTGTGT